MRAKCRPVMSAVISDPLGFRLMQISSEAVALSMNKRMDGFDHFFRYSKMEKNLHSLSYFFTDFLFF